MKLYSKTIITVLALALTFCAKKSSLTVTRNYPERERDCSLDIFIDEKDIKRPFETICIIDTKTGKSAFHGKGLNKVIDIGRPLACRAGSDALIVLAVGRTNGQGFNDAGGSANGILKGIKYTDGGPKPEKLKDLEPKTQMEKSNAAFKKRREAKKNQ
ncbi:MAG: hypothetical protein ABIN80_25415 [Dyadobacter sp.]|uniref:hypothetical protein n=1 Tax=Dyadobacter sp. TaxID=1914288 RepID=UPI00326666FC